MASSDYRSVRPRLTIYVCQEQPSSTALQGQPQAAGSGGESGGGTPSVYHAIYLEEMVASEVARKLASVFNIPFHQINQVYRQGPTGIHILVSDQVNQTGSSPLLLPTGTHIVSGCEKCCWPLLQ